MEGGRISVLPYPLEARNYPYIDRRPGAAGGRSASDPVTVGFVGQVHLRKGAPYFMEVAKRLHGRGIRFVMVGPVYVESSAVARHKDFVDVVGAVPRSRVPDWLRQFDILLFPSTCEGCSSAVMEAMSTGLPVVASPNSGSVVRDGTDGFIRAYDQIDAMAEAVERLASNPSLRMEMGQSASRRAGEFSLDWYGRGLGGVLTELVNPRVSSPIDEGLAVAAPVR